MKLFESQRLYVQKYTNKDTAIFFLLNSDAEVMRYIRKAKTKEESDLFLLENLDFYQQNPGLGRFAVFTKENQQFIGSFSLLPLEGTNDFHLGYALLKPFWGKGFATELVNASLSYVFNTIQKEIVMAITLPENFTSQKVLVNCGFIQTGKMIQEEQEVLVFKKNK